MDDLFTNTPVMAPGTCIGNKYVLGEVLGTGGSAVVYDAEQLGLKRRVAFKVYPLREGTDPAFVERFRREARLMACVHHENIAAAYDSGTLPDGSPFLVVQRARGETLAARLEAGGPLPVDEAVDVGLQVLRALCALGSVGIVHRDVKPDNLMFDRSLDGNAVLKLVDFGVAKHADGFEGDSQSSEGELVGTPHYMSPEQMRAEDVDARSDLYALGATLYEMLTGHTPHQGETLEQVALATLYGNITPVRSLRPDCPEVLERIVLKALARERECRYETASEMRKELERWDATRRCLPVPHAPSAAWSIDSSLARPRAGFDADIAELALPEFEPSYVPAAPARASGSARSMAQGLFLLAVAYLAVVGGWTWSQRAESTSPPAASIEEAATPVLETESLATR